MPRHSIADHVVVAAPTGVEATDEANIAAAITAAGTDGVVWFRSGTYRADNLAPLSGQTWTGPGIIKRPTGSTAAVVSIASKSNVTIENTLDGNVGITFSGNSNNDTYTATGALVNITGASAFCRFKGKAQNNGGPGLRIYDSSYCHSLGADYENCDYGVLIGSGGADSDPGGVTAYNQVVGGSLKIIGKNGIFTTGMTSSGPNPNVIESTVITGTNIFQAGDTAIEVGQGSRNTSVTGNVIDGNVLTTNGTATPLLKSYDGILVREAHGTTIQGNTIKNYATYATGSYAYRTLGNGIYFWPQITRNGTGTSRNCTVVGNVIENCSRSIYAQGNNTNLLSETSTDGGGAAHAAQGTANTNSTTSLTSVSLAWGTTVNGQFVYGAGITPGTTIVSGGGTATITLSATATATATGITVYFVNAQQQDGNVIAGNTVRGGQIGQGTGTQDLNNLSLHGIFLESVSGWQVIGNKVEGVQNDGIRVGDNANSAAYCTDIELLGNRTINNGQQNVAAQEYVGLNFAGASSQTRVYATEHRSGDYQTVKTQDSGYKWNSTGAPPILKGCTSTGSGTPYNGTGSDIYDALGGTTQTSAGNVTAAASDSYLIYNGTGGHTFTLGSATFNGVGRTFLVRNIGTASVRVDRNGAVKLVDLPPNSERIFRSDGTNWLFTPISIEVRADDAINVKDPVYGALGTGGSEPVAPFQSAYNIALALGRDVYVPAGTYFIDDATSTAAIKLTRDNVGTAPKVRLVLDPGVVIKLSTNTPRFIDFNRVAADDTFRAFELVGNGATIDANSIGGQHHVVIGTLQAGTNQSNLTLKDLAIRNVKLKNVAVTADGGTTITRYGVYLSPSGTNATVNNLTNLVVEDIEQLDGGAGCVYLGAAVATATYRYDNLVIRRCKWDRTLTPTVFGAQNGFYIGSRAAGGEMEISDCYARGAGDTNFEINGTEQGVVRDCISVDPMNNHYLIRGANGATTNLTPTSTHRLSFERCQARNIAAVSAKGFKPGIVSTTDPALGMVVLKDCSFYSASTAATPFPSAIYQVDQTNPIDHLVIENFHADYVGLAMVNNGPTVFPACMYFDKGSGRVTIRGMQINLGGSITNTSGTVSIKYIELLGTYKVDWDRVTINDQVTYTGTVGRRGIHVRGTALGGTISRFAPTIASATAGIEFAASPTPAIAPELLLDDCDFTGIAAGSELVIDTTQRTRVRVRDAKHRTFPTIPTVASAAALTLPHFGEEIDVTGAAGITSIVASWPSRVVRLRFAAAATVTTGNNLRIGTSPFAASADDVLTLVCDGTNWHEAARSVNA